MIFLPFAQLERILFFLHSEWLELILSIPQNPKLPSSGTQLLGLGSTSHLTVMRGNIAK